MAKWVFSCLSWSRVAKNFQHCIKAFFHWVCWYPCDPLVILNHFYIPMPGQLHPFSNANYRGNRPTHFLTLRRAASRLHQHWHCQGTWMTLSTQSLTAGISIASERKKLSGSLKSAGETQDKGIAAASTYQCQGGTCAALQPFPTSQGCRCAR